MVDFCKNDSIIDVIHGSIPISGLERMVISSPLYNRMHRILQNSMVYLTFPCNKTKRFEHGIGTMFLAGEIFFNSIANAKKDTITDFFKEIKDEIHNWYESVNRTSYSFLSEDILNIEGENNVINDSFIKSNVPLYKKYIPSNVVSHHFFAYIVTFQATRLAGLLHDIGHLPYSHIMEYALKALYFELKAENPNENLCNIKIKKFLEIFSQYYDEYECELHEEIGKKIVSILRENLLMNFSKEKNIDEHEVLIAAMSIDFAIKILNSLENDDNIFADLHKIISGTIDADRLDYCSRDFYSVGIAKGFIDYSKLFNTYELLKVNCIIDGSRQSQFVFCPSTKSLNIIEDLLYRRWKIYVDINYHHRVQKIHELMIHSVKKIANDYLKSDTELPKESKNCISLGMEAIWDMLDLMIHQKSPKAMEMKLIQLDDSWFDTMVKHQFAIAFQHPLSKNEKNRLWLQLHEFVSTEKHYHSLIKQTDDFYEFDKLLAQSLIEADFSSILMFIDKLDLTSQDENYEKRPSNLKNFILKIKDQHFNYDHYMVNNHGFIFNTLNSELSFIDKSKKMILDMQKEIPKLVMNKINNVSDLIVSVCNIKTGYNPNNPIFLSKRTKTPTGYESRPQEFETMSTIYNSIKEEQCIFPGFYLYVSYIGNIDKKLIFQICAQKVSDIFCSCILEYLTDVNEMIKKSNKED